MQSSTSLRYIYWMSQYLNSHSVTMMRKLVYPVLFLLLMFAPYVKHTSTNVLSQFQQFLITLIKMKLNISLQDLAYRFGISLLTVSRIFLSGLMPWVHVCNFNLGGQRGRTRQKQCLSLSIDLWKQSGSQYRLLWGVIDSTSSLVARAT